MHDDVDYIRFGIALISLLGILLVKIIIMIKPAADLDYEKLSLVSPNYHQELILDGQENRRAD